VGTTTINQTEEETEPVDAEDEAWQEKQQSTKQRVKRGGENNNQPNQGVCMK